MLQARLLEQDGILIITPENALSEDDFHHIAGIVDPYIEMHGRLNGILVQADNFPGWENFSALTSHIRFVKDHHKNIAKIAVVTDNRILEIIPEIARHFVSADIKHFSVTDADMALDWLSSTTG